MAETMPTVIPSPGVSKDIDPLEFARDHLPQFKSEHDLKTMFLTLRIFEFTTPDACLMMKVTPEQVSMWEKLDKQFRYWITQGVTEFRKKMQVELTLSQFYRNMWMALNLDSQILGKAYLLGLDSLSKNEYDFLGKIRPRYSAESLVNMLKVASGDLRDPTTLVVETIFIQAPEQPKSND